MVRTKTKPFLKRKKVPKFYFHFGQQKTCPPFTFNIYLVMWKYNCEPLWLFLFSCYFIRDACAAIWVAQRVCVYEWTIIYISGIVIANIYCMFIVILYGKVCMVKNKIKFVLIVWPRPRGVGATTVPSVFLLINLVTFSYLFHSFTLGLYIVLGFVFLKGKLY